MIRVLVSGSGKMGRAIIDALEAEVDIDVAGVVDKLAKPGRLALPSGTAVSLYNDAAEAFDSVASDVVIDFSNAAWTPVMASAAVARGVRPVIGTTGLSDEYVDALAREFRVRRLGGLIAANFAIGAGRLMHVAKIA